MVGPGKCPRPRQEPIHQTSISDKLVGVEEELCIGSDDGARPSYMTETLTQFSQRRPTCLKWSDVLHQLSSWAYYEEQQQ